jgi:hypothetical protein
MERRHDMVCISTAQLSAQAILCELNCSLYTVSNRMFRWVEDIVNTIDVGIEPEVIFVASLLL